MLKIFQDSKNSSLEVGNLQHFFRQQIDAYKRLKDEPNIELVKEGVKKITFGKNHIVILLSMCYIIYFFIFNWLINLENNKIAVWGANQNGQLGLPLSEPIIPEIKINNLSAIKNIDSYRVIDVECSDDLTYLILEDIKTLKRKIIRLGVDGKDKYHLDKDVRNKKFIVSISF